MKRILLAVAFSSSAPSLAQTSDIPAACRLNAQGGMDYRACAAAATPGSPERALALINLATQAFIARNFAEAVRLYDEAIPPGKTISSDVRFHAFRGAAYNHVGRKEEAYRDARIALDMLMGRATSPQVGPAEDDPAQIYDIVLPILRANNDPDYPQALASYRALPVSDWIGWSNRAAVLLDLGDSTGAIEASGKALQLNATHPGVLNNHCYIVAKAGDPKGAIPWCEKAVAAAPREGAIRHSYATALALDGRCADAEKELAAAQRLDPSSATYKQPLACNAL